MRPQCAVEVGLALLSIILFVYRHRMFDLFLTRSLIASIMTCLSLDIWTAVIPYSSIYVYQELNT